MPLGRGILELFEAIPDRIEVSGHSPTWRVTGGSFESAVSFAEEAFDEPVVVAREDRCRWWPRVTLTVTKDPALAAGAPPLETLADPRPDPPPDAGPDADLTEEPVSDREPDPASEGTLDAMFAYQEARRRRVPRQRSRNRHGNG